LLRKKNKTIQNDEQSYEEYLMLKPKRMDYEWSVDENGLVHIIIPKFNSSIGKKFVKVIKKDQTFTADMDKLGSFVWKLCDGTNTISAILELINNEFKDEESLKDRLFFFFYQMVQLNYIEYK
jgi:hypothetical protein